MEWMDVKVEDRRRYEILDTADQFAIGRGEFSRVFHSGIFGCEQVESWIPVPGAGALSSNVTASVSEWCFVHALTRLCENDQELSLREPNQHRAVGWQGAMNLSPFVIAREACRPWQSTYTRGLPQSLRLLRNDKQEVFISRGSAVFPRAMS